MSEELVKQNVSSTTTTPFVLTKIDKESILDEILNDSVSKFPFLKAPQYFEDLSLGDLKISGVANKNNEKIDTESLTKLNFQNTNGENNTNLKANVNTNVKVNQDEIITYNLNSNYNLNKDEKLNLGFSKYYTALKRIQTFQKNNDIKGFQNYLSESQNKLIKVLLNLKKLNKDLQTDNQDNLNNTYKRIGDNEGFNINQIKDFHSCIKKYEAFQLYLQTFNKQLQTLEPQIINSIQVLWPDILKILDGEWINDLLLSRLELSILRIANFELQEKVRKIIITLFRKAELISNNNVT